VWMLRAELRLLVSEDRLRIGSHGGSTLWAVNNKDGIFILLMTLRSQRERQGLGYR
jgi:hypothetical protein